MSVPSRRSHAADPRRAFATTVVETLRNEGFESLWAGGCVRDELLGKVPKDFDVATTAAPEDVIRIFGPRRTVAVGASFGVVMVLGPTRSSGQVEVATFRSDGEYLDGRRPSSVRFCRPEDDALRRDFTINGLFFDPLRNELIDYVGGRDDLVAGVVRAIGDPVARFREDKLRMLRAVRFTATFHFQLDAATAEAVRQHSREIGQVSVERISQELRRMLSHATRERSVRLLEETGLLREVLPEICSVNGLVQNDQTFDALRALEQNSFEPALSLLLRPLYDAACPDSRRRVERVNAVCRRLKLSNEEVECVCWLLNTLPVLKTISAKPLHVLKPLLAHAHVGLLLDLGAALATAWNEELTDIEFCRNYQATTSAERLNPAPLIDGRDVLEQGVPAGPRIRELLRTVYDDQLDEKLGTRDQALLRLKELIDPER